MTVWVYVIEFADDAWRVGPVKVGFSRHAPDRLASLQTAHYRPLKIAIAYECDDRVDAMRVEREFHQAHRDRRIRGEWFALPGREASLSLWEFL